MRSSVGKECDMQYHIRGVCQYYQLLSTESRKLSSTCEMVSQAHQSAEEMLWAVTCSFQALCCFPEACMYLLSGMSTEAQQDQVAAKADEVITNYICLLKAAEAAVGSSACDHSVRVLAQHSTTLSAIVYMLTHSVKALIKP